MNKRASILQAIFDAKRRRVETEKSLLGPEGLSEMASRARRIAETREPFRLSAALRSEAGPNIIAEFKRASPSKGPIDIVAEPTVRAAEYESSGAAAISVLTEEDHFQGSAEDLRRISEAVSLPVLRKDFIFDPFQIFEATILGADAVLLIAAMLDDEKIQELMDLAGSLGLDTLVEVHDAEELERIRSLDARLIGVNNRDLRTFRVSLDVSRELIRRKPAEALMVAESGIGSREEIEELRELGFNGFLIGEAAMKYGLEHIAGSRDGRRTAEASQA